MLQPSIELYLISSVAQMVICFICMALCNRYATSPIFLTRKAAFYTVLLLSWVPGIGFVNSMVGIFVLIAAILHRFGSSEIPFRKK